MIQPNKRPRVKVTPEMAAVIKKQLNDNNLFQHEIAAEHGINQGRISEIANGIRFAEIKPAN
tara:strand:+ start:2597 stop:2782 length:186 start_codon:yes stop_codon:yes gene_type:complete